MEEQDIFFMDAVKFCQKVNYASAASLQRRYKIGYTRAKAMIDKMEEQQIIKYVMKTSSYTLLSTTA